jgi:hypothetical protein
MGMIEVNYIGVLAAAAASFAVGALWYSPLLFGRQWMALMGFTEESMRTMRIQPVVSMLFGFVAQLIMVYFFAHFAVMWGIADLADAITLAFFVWLGFQATVMAHSFLWDGKPAMLYVLNVGHQLAAMLVVALVIYFTH